MKEEEWISDSKVEDDLIDYNLVEAVYDELEDLITEDVADPALKPFESQYDFKI